LKFTPRRGKVTVTASAENGQARDSGIGMSRVEEKITDSFVY
jgi:signal transduction histidine kinase